MRKKCCCRQSKDLNTAYPYFTNFLRQPSTIWIKLLSPLHLITEISSIIVKCQRFSHKRYPMRDELFAAAAAHMKIANNLHNMCTARQATQCIVLPRTGDREISHSRLLSFAGFRGVAIIITSAEFDAKPISSYIRRRVLRN